MNELRKAGKVEPSLKTKKEAMMEEDNGGGGGCRVSIRTEFRFYRTKYNVGLPPHVSI